MSKYDNLKIARLQEIGCLACYVEGHPGTPGDLHHPTVAGRRLGDDVYFVLCPWHHRGISPHHPRITDKHIAEIGLYGATVVQAEQPDTPSLAKSKKAFVERYGTEQELLSLSERLLKERYDT